MTFTQKSYKSWDIVFVLIAPAVIWKAKIVRKNKDKKLPGDYIIKDRDGYPVSISKDMVYSRLSSANRAIMNSIIYVDLLKADAKSK